MMNEEELWDKAFEAVKSAPISRAAKDEAFGEMLSRLELSMRSPFRVSMHDDCLVVEYGDFATEAYSYTYEPSGAWEVDWIKDKEIVETTRHEA